MCGCRDRKEGKICMNRTLTVEKSDSDLGGGGVAMTVECICGTNED